CRGDSRRRRRLTLDARSGRGESLASVLQTGGPPSHFPRDASGQEPATFATFGRAVAAHFYDRLPDARADRGVPGAARPLRLRRSAVAFAWPLGRLAHG